jgi:hypothetical protein
VRIPIRLRTAALCVALAAPVAGQSSQYSEPGALGRPPVDRREALRQATDEARWHLGALRLDPWLSLRELAWVDEATADGGTTRDLTATVGAGLRAYLPIGPRTTLAARALPEYVWWRDRADARRVAGRYALGAFVYGHRLGLELAARSDDTTNVVSAEVNQRVRTRDERLDLRLDVRLAGSLGLFARGTDGRVRTGDHDLVPELARLDRDESWWVGGLTWSFTRDLVLGVGVGTLRTDFVTAADQRSHDGRSLYGELRWQRPKLQAGLELSREKRTARAGSGFPGFEGTLGEARVRWQPRERLGASLYGLRRLSWSLEAGRFAYLDRRAGAALDLRLGRKGGLEVFHETGKQEYVGDLLPARTDDVTSSGAAGRMGLGRHMTVGVQLRRTRLDNADLALRRDFREVRFGVTFGGGAEDVF